MRKKGIKKKVIYEFDRDAVEQALADALPACQKGRWWEIKLHADGSATLTQSEPPV